MGKSPSHCWQCHPWVGVPKVYKNVIWATHSNMQEVLLLCGFCFSSSFQVLAWVPELIYLNYRLWCGSIRQINPVLRKLVFFFFFQSSIQIRENKQKLLTLPSYYTPSQKQNIHIHVIQQSGLIEDFMFGGFVDRLGSRNMGRNRERWNVVLLISVYDNYHSISTWHSLEETRRWVWTHLWGVI